MVVQLNNGAPNPESYEERQQRRLQLVYKRQTHERQLFMQDLKAIRRRRELNLFKAMKDLIGPTWLQALSEPQRKALDTLEFSIYQDLLEGRPVRTASIIRTLGIYPRPNTLDLMNCVYLGRKDPKEMLAQLFLMTYGHPIEGKRGHYDLNSRLMLSGILYLGLENLLQLLRIRFRPDKIENTSKPKAKMRKQPSLESPYLQELTAALYVPPKRKPFRPAPLPNLEDLNEPYEEDPPVPKPLPPPPPPPPPKKRLARSYCDKIAGVMNIEPYSTVTTTHTVKTFTQRSFRKAKGSKLSLDIKKSYGFSVSRTSKGRRRKKLSVPNTRISNAKYMINGVFTVQGKTVFLLGNVSLLPAEGDLIHGGYRLINGAYMNIHCGFRGRPPPPQKTDACDCVKKWQDAVFKYVKENKCRCGHLYDYGNEGTFPPEELPYFQKATRFAPFQFNYHTIYNLDEKQLFVEKEFKRIWDTESALHVGEDFVVEKKDKKKKKAKRSSNTCLGQSPKPEDYLKCALRHMRRLNIAAKLPDIHLVPELKEWMRRRIYGPYNEASKRYMLRNSFNFWQLLLKLENNGFGHVSPKKDPAYTGLTTWQYKQELNDKFKKYSQKYKLDLFRTYAKCANILWPTMCQAQFPDKKFREIYFSYLSDSVENLHLLHPYTTREAVERAVVMGRRRYTCRPDGAEDVE